MVDKTTNEDERALRVLENVYSGADGDDDGEPINETAVARMRTAVDASFARAWKAVHAQAEAEAAARAVDGERARARTALIARGRAYLLGVLAELREALGPQLQLAHRDAVELTDDDLCGLIEDLRAHVNLPPDVS